MALWTPQQVKDLKLFGVNLTQDEGQPYPDAMFTHGVDWATEHVFGMLNLKYGSTDYATITAERHSQDPNGMLLFLLSKTPVREMVSVRVRIGTYPIMDVPTSWVDLEDAESGMVQIVPVSNSAVILSYPALYQSLLMRNSRATGLWEFTYKAGFKDSDCPADIKQLVALHAIRDVLITAGDLIAGAGIASQSVSMDGLSQSIGTTASATNSGYGSRLIENNKIIKNLEERLLAKYSSGYVAIL